MTQPAIGVTQVSSQNLKRERHLPASYDLHGDSCKQSRRVLEREQPAGVFQELYPNKVGYSSRPRSLSGSETEEVCRAQLIGKSVCAVERGTRLEEARAFPAPSSLKELPSAIPSSYSFTSASNRK